MKPLQETKAMNQPRCYKLIKDLPDAKAGTVLTLDIDGGKVYDYQSNRTIESDNETLSWYRKEFVENNPEWFQEILPPQSIKETESSDKEKEISLISRCLAYLSLDTTNVPQGLYKDVYNYLYPPAPAPLQPESEYEATMKQAIKDLFNRGQAEIVTLTNEEYLNRLDKAFSAARYGVGITKNGTCYEPAVKYPTFQDYLKSLNPDNWKHEALKREQALFNK